MYVKRQSSRVKRNKRFNESTQNRIEKYDIASENNSKKTIPLDKRSKPKLPPIQTFKLNERQKKLYELLKAQYPLVFNETAPLPLKKGIRQLIKADLISRGYECPTKLLHMVLMNFTGSLPYRKALVDKDYRYSLNGEIDAKVTPDEKRVALASIKYFIKNFDLIKQRIAQKQKEERKR